MLATAAALPVATVPSLAVGDDADARVFRLAERCRAAYRAQCAANDACDIAEQSKSRGSLEQAEDALSEAVVELCNAQRDLANVTALTLAGIVEKARIVRIDPNDDFDTYSVADLANSIVDDLLVLGEGRSS